MLSTIRTFVLNELTLQKRVFFLNTHKNTGEIINIHCKFCWVKFATISCEKKKIKWATKLAIKKEKMEKGKKREEERKIKIILEKSPKVVLYACANQKAT